MSELPSFRPRAVGDKRLSIADQVKALQGQAGTLANQHVEAFSHQIEELARAAAEIAGGGGAYAHGAREVARALADQLDAASKTLGAIAARR